VLLGETHDCWAAGVQIPFRVELEPAESASALLETYHGAYVSITYAVSVEVKRPVLKRTLQASTEFIVEGPRGQRDQSQGHSAGLQPPI
jgi:hypothetical protein